MTLLEVLQQHAVPVAPEGHHHAREGWVQIDCPFCSPGSARWRLGLHKSGKFGNCWTCGGHSVYETLMEVLASQLPRGEIHSLAKALSADNGYVPIDQRPRGKLKLPLKHTELLVAQCESFLERRGFDARKLQQLWKIGSSSSGNTQWSIFIPVFVRGEMVSWTTRLAVTRHGGRQPRYKSASPSEETLPHKELLYGEDYARDTIVICEGPLDVWAVGPGAVCTFGTQFTRAQLVKMARYPNRVVCFDAEPAAQEQAQKLCDALQVFSGQTTNVVMETGKDPSRAKRSEVNELRSRFLSL